MKIPTTEVLFTRTHAYTHTHRFEKRREMERERAIAIEYPMFERTSDAEVGVFQVAEVPKNRYEYPIQ